MAHDAPLLFTSPDPKRQQLVDATISDWQKIETPKGPLIIIQNQRAPWRAIDTTLPELIAIQNLPEVITIQNEGDVAGCLANGDSADVDGVSTLDVSNPILRFPKFRVRQTLEKVPVRQTLEPVVVFAAAIEPGDPPDVAVGLALAAHMARANQENVSLVVVPHYLESDRELEKKLQGQHELVTGGVVLGQTPTVPEEARALLRQLLTSTDQQGLLGQVQANLGSVGPLVAALLALVGFGAAARVTPEITPQAANLVYRIAQVTPSAIKAFPSRIESLTRRGPMSDKNSRQPTPARAALLAGLSPGQNVTVWLHSQWKVTGKVVGKYDDTKTVLLLEDAKLEQQGHQLELGGGSMRVPVEDIELIWVNVRETKPSA
jgi:hypothetical protein